MTLDLLLGILAVLCAPVPVLPLALIAYFIFRDADGVIRM